MWMNGFNGDSTIDGLIGRFIYGTHSTISQDTIDSVFTDALYHPNAPYASLTCSCKNYYLHHYIKHDEMNHLKFG